MSHSGDSRAGIAGAIAHACSCDQNASSLNTRQVFLVQQGADSEQGHVIVPVLPSWQQVIPDPVVEVVSEIAFGRFPEEKLHFSLRRLGCRVAAGE